MQNTRFAYRPANTILHSIESSKTGISYVFWKFLHAVQLVLGKGLQRRYKNLQDISTKNWRGALKKTASGASHKNKGLLNYTTSSPP